MTYQAALRGAFPAPSLRCRPGMRKPASLLEEVTKSLQFLIVPAQNLPLIIIGCLERSDSYAVNLRSAKSCLFSA
jgi:hypothetical protein